MTHECLSAAVSFQAKGIKNFLSLFSFLSSFRIFFPEVCNLFSTTVTSNLNYHLGLICRISELLIVLVRDCLVLRVLCVERLQQVIIYRILKMCFSKLRCC